MKIKKRFYCLLLIVMQIFIYYNNIYADESEIVKNSENSKIDFNNFVSSNDIDSIGYKIRSIEKSNKNFDEFYEIVSSVGEKQAKVYIFFSNDLFKEFIKNPNHTFLEGMESCNFRDIGIYDYYFSESDEFKMRFISLNDPVFCTVYKDIEPTEPISDGTYFFH